MSDDGRGAGRLLEAELGPGIHLRPGEPPAALAERLGAELLITTGDVAAALENGPPPVTPVQLDELARIVTRVEVASRVVERTRQRAAAVVAERLAGTAGAELAIHPAAYRDAAARVIAARTALADATAELEEHRHEIEAMHRELAEAGVPTGPADAAASAAFAAGDASGSVEAVEPIGPVEPVTDVVDQPVSEHARLVRRRSLGGIAVALGLGLIGFALGGTPLWVALLPTLVVCLVEMWLLRDRGDGDEAEDDDRDIGAASSRGESGEVQDHLAAVAAAAEEAFGARRRAELERADQTELLAARRGRAEEDLRVAERAWHDLAGPDADPNDVDEVIRRRDPQHQEALVLAAETATVRAAGALLERSLQRWASAWSALGLPVPEPVHAGAVVDLRTRAMRSLVLVGPAALQAEQVAAARPAAAVVVVPIRPTFS